MTVRVLKVKQIAKNDLSFNDKILLVLNETNLETIIQTRLVDTMFKVNWSRYSKIII